MKKYIFLIIMLALPLSCKVNACDSIPDTLYGDFVIVGSLTIIYDSATASFGMGIFPSVAEANRNENGKYGVIIIGPHFQKSTIFSGFKIPDTLITPHPKGLKITK